MRDVVMYDRIFLLPKRYYKQTKFGSLPDVSFSFEHFRPVLLSQGDVRCEA